MMMIIGMDCPRVGYEDLKAAASSDLTARGFKCSNETVFNELTDKVRVLLVLLICVI